jgi:hypothetical protein
VITLFQSCVQSFEFIQDLRHHEVDLQKLSIKLSVQNIRLFTWGESVGLGQSYRPGQSIALERCSFLGTVEAVLKVDRQTA